VARPRHPLNAGLLLHHVRIACVTMAFLVSFGNRARALDGPEPAGGYVSKNFSLEDGLLSNNVNVILQTRDGFLWIGTPEGLLRFDGRHFTPIKFLPQDSPVVVSTLAEAPDGALWVGTPGGLARIPSGGSSELGHTVSSLYHPGSGDGDSVQCLHFSRNGDLWVGTLTGLYRFADGKFSAIIPKLWTSRIEEASNGHLLVITSQGFVEWNGKQIIPHTDLPARLGVVQHGIFHVLEDHTGTIWYATAAGVARERGGSIERLNPYGGDRNPNVVYRLYEDTQGHVWFAQSGELYRATAAGQLLSASHLDATYLASDVDGDLWAGTKTRGLFRLKSRAVKMFTAADGLPVGMPVAVLAARDGKLWVGSYCGGLSQFDGRRFQTYMDKDGINSCVFSLAEDHNHDILVGIHGGGVSRFRDGRFTQVSSPDRLTNRVVTAIVPGRNGPLWIAYSDGLDRIADGQVRRFTTADGLSSNSLLSAYEDRRGVLWVETTRGIDRLQGDRFVSVLTADSASTEAGGFGFGEDRFGHLFAFGPANATFDIQENRAVRLNGAPRITGMAQSPENLWFCGDGIYRATPDSLEKWEHERDTPAEYTVFNRADGMNSTLCSGGFRNMAVTSDGRLWAATQQGIAMLEFSRLRHTDRKPVIFIERIVIGKSVQAPGRELTLPAGTQHVELHFDAIELASPEATRLQYRLDGVDREWLDADSGVTAVYSGIPAGTHQFHVRACNSDGVWDQAGISYNVTQKPYFYETNLFRFAAVIILALLLAGAYQLRLRRMTAQMNARLDERVAERTRLARDLHDTLLQTIQATKLIAEAEIAGADDSVPARKTLEKLATMLGQAMQEARASLLSLRTSTTEANHLADGLRRAGEESATAYPLRFTFMVEGTVKEMHPVVRDEVYRIGYEAIRNAFHHSGGTEVQVVLSYTHSLELIVRDDGKGIDPDIAVKGKPSHFGLTGMQERAVRIGAKLSISSSANTGTKLELIVPGHVIFSRPRLGLGKTSSGVYIL
jgi:signal transduction histidine kinase/ligand-binding sensor domain-containing protein